MSILSNPILSIIVPTKNRYNTLLPLLKALCSFVSSNFEIVIQDNSKNNSEIINYLKINKDIRLKYFHCSDNLSVIENSDLAVKNTNGEYICFIGDDDGVMPYIVEVVEWMKKDGIKALKCYRPHYYWPDQKSNYLSKNTSGILRMKNFNYSRVKMSSQKALNYTLNKGGTSMAMLPCLYHGIVEKDVLLAIYKKCNTFFPGPSPDMANAIALTNFIQDYIYVDFPVVISGKSVKSTGGQGVLHRHLSRIEDVGHLPKYTGKNWSKEIPKYWTGPTIWAESVIQSLKNCGNINALKKFNFAFLYATIMVFNRRNKKEIFQEFPFKVYSFAFFISYFRIFINRVYIFFKNRFSYSINEYKNIKDIGKTIKLINEKVDRKKIVFKINKDL